MMTTNSPKKEQREGTIPENPLKGKFSAQSIPLEADFAELIDRADVGCRAVGQAYDQDNTRGGGLTLLEDGKLAVSVGAGLALDQSDEKKLIVDTKAIQPALIFGDTLTLEGNHLAVNTGLIYGGLIAVKGIKNEKGTVRVEVFNGESTTGSGAVGVIGADAEGVFLKTGEKGKSKRGLGAHRDDKGQYVLGVVSDDTLDINEDGALVVNTKVIQPALIVGDTLDLKGNNLKVNTDLIYRGLKTDNGIVNDEGTVRVQVYNGKSGGAAGVIARDADGVFLKTGDLGNRRGLEAYKGDKDEYVLGVFGDETLKIHKENGALGVNFDGKTIVRKSKGLKELKVDFDSYYMSIVAKSYGAQFYATGTYFNVFIGFQYWDNGLDENNQPNGKPGCFYKARIQRLLSNKSSATSYTPKVIENFEFMVEDAAPIEFAFTTSLDHSVIDFKFKIAGKSADKIVAGDTIAYNIELGDVDRQENGLSAVYLGDEE